VVRRRLELPSSPYAARLAVADGLPALLTTDALYRLDAQSAQRTPFSEGALGVLAGDSVVRWHQGRLWRSRGASRDWLALTPLPQPPHRLVASPHGVVWTEVAAGSAASIWTLAGAEPRQLRSAPGGVAALALRDDQVFFVEELVDGRWRLGGVSLGGSSERYGEAHSGRPPAMLAVTSDVFYYDGPSLSVYRVSTDLRRTERVAADIICSPLAAAESVYCAQPPGAIVELSLSGRGPRLLAGPLDGTVTALSATPTEVTWLREAGGGLVVESVSL
jgi:hypothetical protein